MPISKLLLNCTNGKSESEMVELDLSSKDLLDLLNDYIRSKTLDTGISINDITLPLTVPGNLQDGSGNSVSHHEPSFDYKKNFVLSSHFTINSINYTRREYRISSVDVITCIDDVISFFQALWSHEISALSSRDKIQFNIETSGLSKSFYTHLMFVDDFHIETMLSCIEKVIKSNENFIIDSTTRIGFTTCLNPSGAGYKAVATLEDNLKKKCVIAIRNADEIYMARALVVGLAVLNDDPMNRNIKEGRSEQKEQAMHLLKRLGLPTTRLGLDSVAKIEEYLKISILVVDWFNGNKVIYPGDSRYYNKEARCLALLKSNDHFHCITKINAYYANSHWCFHCCKATKAFHKCTETCNLCCNVKCNPDSKIVESCSNCNKSFYQGSCLALHQAKGCGDDWSCITCKKIYKREDYNDKVENHKCGDKVCRNCGVMVRFGHRCYLKPREPPTKEVAPLQLAFFDFECYADANGVHHVNLVTVLYQNSEEFFIFYNIQEFYDWLVDLRHNEFRFIAHNSAGYDAQFILKHMIDNCFTPDTITNGTKIIQMIVKRNNLTITFIDSLNFMNRPLSKLPSMFGIENEVRKGFFPHFFNKPENMEFIGKLSDIPKEMFGLNNMKKAVAESFLKWYDLNGDRRYDFKYEFVEYCKNDTFILKRCCLLFRGVYRSLTHIDPFRFPTISSACYHDFRLNYLKEKTIPIYYPPFKKSHSRAATLWLEYTMQSTGSIIRHANRGGEYRIPELGIFVDGYCHSTGVVYEFHGCFYHACPRCYPDQSLVNPKNQNKTMEEIYKATLERTAVLRDNGYVVEEMWECDFLSMLKVDLDLQKFNENYEFIGSLDVQDAYYGARVNATVLYYETKEDEKVLYYDYTSLYPYVASTMKFPCCHPTKYYSGQLRKLENVEDYFGFIKCKILPPRGLIHPVLPSRINGKLMFVLCHTCAVTNSQHVCNHNELERSLTGTWVTEEVSLALKKDTRL